MSRRLHACLTCPARTRHDDQICAACRRAGHSNRGGVVRLVLVAGVPDVAAPRRSDVEIDAHLARELTAMLAGWRGTDSDSPTIPGRYA